MDANELVVVVVVVVMILSSGTTSPSMKRSVIRERKNIITQKKVQLTYKID